MLPQHTYRQDAKAVVNVERFPLVNISGIYSASGDNQIVAAPGVDKRIVVTSFTMQNEDSQTAAILILRSDTSTTNAWRVYTANQGDGLSKTFAAGYEWKLNENEPLNLNLSAAVQCNCSVEYYIEHWEGV